MHKCNIHRKGQVNIQFIDNISTFKNEFFLYNSQRWAVCWFFWLFLKSVIHVRAHRYSYIYGVLVHYTEKAMAPHSSTLAWKIRWMEEPGRLQSMRSLRVGHDWATSLSLFTFHALEKEMATHSSVLAWRIPETEEPGRRLSMGSHRVGHDWSDLAAAAA